jgi:2-oxoisovalerate dehydrogenase E1 component
MLTTQSSAVKTLAQLGSHVVQAVETDFLVNAYSRMVLIRTFEERAARCTSGADPLIAGSIHTCCGQEAIPVGAMSALSSGDRVVATYRGHGWALERGVTPAELMAEMAHRATGINGGRAGSLLASAPNRGFVGQNSIVGAGGPIACGVAIAAKVMKTGRVVIVSFGDGALSQGGLHEAFICAATAGLPVVFVCENNGWSEMTPASYVLQPGTVLKRAAGYGICGIEVDGCDVTAVHDAVAQAASRARAGDGPTLIEANAVRLGGHYNRDIQHYRSSADKVAAQERDPLARTRRQLLQMRVDEATLQQIESEAAAAVEDAVARASGAPHPDPRTLRDHVFGQASRHAATTPAGNIVNLSYARAIRQALQDEMELRPEVIVFGEDVARAGGIFGVTRDLLASFGSLRVFDTPIAETGILGSAVGAALDGLRPVAEIMFADFLFVGLDQLVNQAAKLRYVSNGLCGVPLVIRTQQGVTPGACAQHAQCVEAFLAHVPGLKVGLPVTPSDAYSMLRAAIGDPDPCIIVEARSLYLDVGDVCVGGAVEAASGANLVREGEDIAIISWGTAVTRCLAAAESLAKEGIEASVLNLRWLSPLDRAAIRRVVEACGRVLIVHDAPLTGGFGAEVAAGIAECHSELLKAPVARIGAIDVPMPASPRLQRCVIPTPEDILKRASIMVNPQRFNRKDGTVK